MKTTTAVLPAVVLAFLGLVVTPPAEAAVPHLEIHLSRTILASGDPFTVSARANVTCDWIVEFHGERRHTIARSIRTTFTAPEVTRRTRLNVVATCVVHSPPAQHREISAAAGSGSPRDMQALVVRIPANATVDPPVTVVPGPVVEPPHSGGHGGLPNTGGPSLWLIELGLGLVLIGTTTARIARRQRSEATASDIPRVAS
jgi:hypothetical protein